MTFSYLDVTDIKVDGEKVKWDVTPRTEPYGSPISVKVGKDVAKDKEIEIAVSANAFTSFCSARS
jgi:leukotriene-A4 hydrolase